MDHFKKILLILVVFLGSGCASLELTDADYTRQLRQLQQEYDSGSITQDDYDQQKQGIIESRSQWRSGLNSRGDVFMGTSF